MNIYIEFIGYEELDTYVQVLTIIDREKTTKQELSIKWLPLEAYHYAFREVMILYKRRN